MPTARNFAALFLAVILVFVSATASAERITFDSAAKDTNYPEIFQGRTAYTDHIYGELQLPKGSGPFPTMVIMHSSRGVVPAIRDWAKLFNDMGVATFVVDSFTPRGLTEPTADRLSLQAGVVDSLRALKVLRQDQRIDPAKIGIIGFSRGAIAAMDSSFERLRKAVLGADDSMFAFHIVFYGGCAQYAKTTGRPILNFLGTADDFNNLEVCRKDTEILNQQGTPTELVVYQGALHGFDTDYPRQDMPMLESPKNCRLLINLDTFDAMLADGRPLTAAERMNYPKTCMTRGAARGGDRKYAAAARDRARQFVTMQFDLPH